MRKHGNGFEQGGLDKFCNMFHVRHKCNDNNNVYVLESECDFQNFAKRSCKVHAIFKGTRTEANQN